MRSWADDFNTYQDACDFYGCDGPRELVLEAAADAAEWQEECMDRMMAGEVQPGIMWPLDCPF